MLTNSLMQPLVGMYQQNKMDQWEILFSQYGVWGAFQNENDQSNSIISPENREKLKYSWGNTVPIVVINGDDVVIGNTYSCSIDDVVTTSTKVIPTFTQYAWGWNMLPSMYKTGPQPTNYVQYEQDFQHKADQFLKAFLEVLDTKSRNILETNKNIYWPANIPNYYAVVGDSLQIPQNQKDDAFNQLSAVVRELDLYEACLVIGSTSLTPMTRRLEAQGEGNATNERFQFLLGNFIFTGSNRVTNGVNIQSTGYLVQPGSIATFSRLAPDNLAGRCIGGREYPQQEWSTMMLPRVNIEVGTYYSQNCADNPAESGFLIPNLSATVKEGFGFRVEVGWITNYNSNPAAKVNPIVKFEIAN